MANVHGWGISRALGSGTMRVFTGTNPAAGSQFLEVVPAGFVWRIVSIQAIFVADATVISRIVKLSMDGGAVPRFYSSEANIGHPANITDYYIWSISGRTGITATFLAAGMFDLLIALADGLYLGPGMRFFSEVVNMQAGDDWDAPQFLVEEWAL